MLPIPPLKREPETTIDKMASPKSRVSTGEASGPGRAIGGLEDLAAAKWLNHCYSCLSRDAFDQEVLASN